MKLKIKGKGHPSAGDWSITDENDVPLLVRSIELFADSDDLSIKVDLFEHPDLDFEGDAIPVCSLPVAQMIEKDGRRIALCDSHANALRYLSNKGVFMGVGFDFDISEAPKCPLYTCGQRIDE